MDLKIKENVGTMSGAFGISDERRDELGGKAHEVITKFCPSGSTAVVRMPVFLKEIVALCDTLEETVWLLHAVLNFCRVSDEQRIAKSSHEQN